MLIRGALLAAGSRGDRRDVRIEGRRIAEIAPALRARTGEPQLEARGGLLLPGLHDHHLHLLALAAALESVPCGPPQVRSRGALAAALAGARPRDGWLRGVGYHDSVAGALDRRALDGLRDDVPLRVQHRSGSLWMLNSLAVEQLAVEGSHARETGRLYDADAWLRRRLGRVRPPDLRPVGRLLARAGVTGVTDATVGNGPEELGILLRAVEAGELPQRLRVMGGDGLPDPEHPRVERGERKLLLHERALPAFDALQRCIEDAHDRERAVAIHCVSRAEVWLAIAALRAAGGRPGDRLEHASVAPPEAVEALGELPAAVVSQPNFLVERGDAYRVEVEPRDLPWLYRARGFLAAGVPLGFGSDAPFGRPDPWAAMRAAVERRSADGVELGGSECLTPQEALERFLSPLDAPGGPARRVEAGAPADLCLLDAAPAELLAGRVVATLADGHLVFSATDAPEAGPSR